MDKKNLSNFNIEKEQIKCFLLEKRIILLSTHIDNNSSQDIVEKLWYLNFISDKEPIIFVINSGGGSIYDGLAIYDQMALINAPIATVVTGLAASMASILMLGGKAEWRFATKNAKIMIHQPRIMQVIEGQATDIDITAKEINKTKNTIINIYHEKTNLDKKLIDCMLERDNWLNIDQALELKLVNKVINNINELKNLIN